MSTRNEDNRHESQLCDTCRQKEYEAYRHACVHLAIDGNKKWHEQYRILEWPRWDFDADAKILTFSQKGEPKVRARVAVVGTVQGNEWQWVWSNHNFSVEERNLIHPVREFGVAKGWSQLSESLVKENDSDGWELTSIALHLLDGQWTYRFPTDLGYCYLIALETNWIDELRG